MDKAQLNALFTKTKQMGKPDTCDELNVAFVFLDVSQVSLGPGAEIGPRSQGGTAWSCYCWDFFNSASASWTQEAEKVRGGDEEVCVLK